MSWLNLRCPQQHATPADPAGRLSCMLASCPAAGPIGAPRRAVRLGRRPHRAAGGAGLRDARSGIRVDMVGDTEQKKTTGLANRLRAEKDNPQADVFWSSEVFNTMSRLAEAGRARRVRFTARRPAGPASFAIRPHRWYGFAARARVIVYAPDRVVGRSTCLRTWMDLTKPQVPGAHRDGRPPLRHHRRAPGGDEGCTGRGIVGPLPTTRRFLMGLADNEVRHAAQRQRRRGPGRRHRARRTWDSPTLTTCGRPGPADSTWT